MPSKSVKVRVPMRADEVPTSSPIMNFNVTEVTSRVGENQAIKERQIGHLLVLVTRKRVEAISDFLLSEGMPARYDRLTSNSNSNGVCNVAYLALGGDLLPAISEIKRVLDCEVRLVFGPAVRIELGKTAKVDCSCRLMRAAESGKSSNPMGRNSATFMPLRVPKGEVVRAVDCGMRV